MRVDIFRRTERDGSSFLAVPEGKPIPAEATNIDWTSAARAVEVDEATDRLNDYAIVRPIRQISAKGYAISSVLDITRQPH